MPAATIEKPIVYHGSRLFAAEVPVHGHLLPASGGEANRHDDDEVPNEDDQVQVTCNHDGDSQKVIVSPPSTVITWPVMYEASGPARKAATPAISSGCAARRNGR